MLREQILSQKPTDEQGDAIFANELEFLLRASPGSGKTWTSCRRFIWRGANWDYKAGGLALLSFTNTAIREFQDATIKVGRRDLLSDPNYVGTFDSFVERFIITPFGHLVMGSSKRPKLHIAPRVGDRSNKKLNAWSEANGGRMLQVPAWEIIPFPSNGDVAYRASKKLGGKILEFTWHNPVEEFFKLGFYTHAQRVYLACLILQNRPHISGCISRRFPEIIVDEAQDTNIWLLILLNQLREKGTKVTLIGDPDQCIYEFSMADATSLSVLKDRWSIPEKPLSRSFRCNDKIAESVRNIGGNSSFVGCGASKNEYQRAFIVREPDTTGFRYCIAEFVKILELAGISQSNSAILCRAHHQLESIRGEVNYTDLQGLTKEMALAAFHRDARKDYKRAYQIVENSLRNIIDDPGFWENIDDDPESETALRVRLVLWRFTKSTLGLPSINKSGAEWIESLKTNLTNLLTAIGVISIPKMGQKIRRTGLGEEQLVLPLFEPQALFPPIRQETIHQVKGESIDGVLVLGSTKFFNSVVDAIKLGRSTEERRLAYVAMTRARHVLLIGLPASHYDKHISSWQNWGFSAL